MTRKGPLITLLGGGAVAAVLLVASMNAAGEPDDDAALAGASATPAAPATPTAAPAPSPSPSPEPAEPVTYVGYVDGGGASVAIAVTGDEAIAYVCDGAELEAWFSGSAANGELLLDSEQGDTLFGSYDEEAAAGETTADGRTWTFTVAQVAPPEGLYRFADTIQGGAEVEGGWIVTADGQQVGVLTVDGEPRSAPELDPATGEVTVAGQTITAERVG